MALDVEGMSGWGEAPGDIMVVERNGTKYFVLPGIQFGNIFIGPEPQRGWEGDADQLYHNMAVPLTTNTWHFMPGYNNRELMPWFIWEDTPPMNGYLEKRLF